MLSSPNSIVRRVITCLLRASRLDQRIGEFERVFSSTSGDNSTYGTMPTSNTPAHIANVNRCDVSDVCAATRIRIVGIVPASAPSAWPPSRTRLYHARVHVRPSADVVEGRIA